jgi:hypothetical protein
MVTYYILKNITPILQNKTVYYTHSLPIETSAMQADCVYLREILVSWNIEGKADSSCNCVMISSACYTNYVWYIE